MYIFIDKAHDHHHGHSHEHGKSPPFFLLYANRLQIYICDEWSIKIYKLLFSWILYLTSLLSLYLFRGRLLWS